LIQEQMWPGGITMVRVEGGLAAWELRLPMQATKDIRFGFVAVGATPANAPWAIQVTGGLGPFYGGSFSPNPRIGADLPVRDLRLEARASRSGSRNEAPRLYWAPFILTASEVGESGEVLHGEVSETMQSHSSRGRGTWISRQSNP
jgi:hypothetical protein